MEKPGLYIHVPFCRSKCPYCAFFSIPSKRSVPAWFKAFKKEGALLRDKERKFGTIYIGGGTPTCLDVHYLEGIMSSLQSLFSFSTEAEVTIEANPRDLDSATVSIIKEIGINRVSVGIQSFDNRILNFLGRRHNASEAKRAVENLQYAGVTNISLDLIYGIEGQSMKSWMETLDTALSFQPQHLSCYQLSIEKNTPFYSLRKKGIITELPESEQRHFFLSTSDYLEHRGYIHYEVSSFAAGEKFLSRHNSKYWSHLPYLGIGPSAHSYDGTHRWWNVGSIRKYVERCESGRLPVEGSELISAEKRRLETLCLGARTQEGFPIECISPGDEAMEILDNFYSKGLLSLKNGRAIPTKEGLLLADYIASCLA